MLLLKLKPNWRYIHQFKKRSFIHFNNQTFGNGNSFTQEFKDSFHHLPPDKYIPNNNPVTRSRKYANILVDVTDNYEYSLIYTENDIFKQNVDDNRGVERKFELIDKEHIQNVWFLDFITQISALSVLNHNYYKGHKLIKEVDIHLHQVRQTAYSDIESHNSPEGIHRDGCDYIISAFVISRNNIIGGESIIYNQNKMVEYKTILDSGEGIYQEDIKQWHYVTPIQTSEEGIGYRDILGIDIILNT